MAWHGTVACLDSRLDCQLTGASTRSIATARHMYVADFLHSFCCSDCNGVCIQGEAGASVRLAYHSGKGTLIYDNIKHAICHTACCSYDEPFARSIAWRAASLHELGACPHPVAVHAIFLRRMQADHAHACTPCRWAQAPTIPTSPKSHSAPRARRSAAAATAPAPPLTPPRAPAPGPGPTPPPPSS